MRWLLVIGLALGLVGMGSWRLDTASGEGTVTRVVSPGSWPAGGGSFEVRIEIQDVTNLGSYELQLEFDPAVVFLEGRSEDGTVVPALTSDCTDKIDNDGDTHTDSNDPDCFLGVANGPFLERTGRTVFCPPLILDVGSVRFGCNTSGGKTRGPDGSGLLSTLTFSPVAAGTSNLNLVWASLSDPYANEDIPSQRQGSCVAIGAGASCASPTVAPPATATAAATGTPGAAATPTATPGTGATPTPTGPTPTPTPLPPGFEAVPLVAGCNPVASTYPDGTPIQTIAEAVGPAGNLVSLWRLDFGTWQAFSPQYPADSDLTQVDILDVVFACVGGTGAFVRPVV